ncbi:response regulator [Rhizobium sp. KVB221]|uniref:histidine kinase n=1 Tax=Rhizobium setariae TaxID=2801340 RepID=A0A937CPH9_9HYPH|nr:ATP-binding protein [Rhizobium setariae]MBL0371827.1 response regulator [Rhizobium setariae]
MSEPQKLQRRVAMAFDEPDYLRADAGSGFVSPLNSADIASDATFAGDAKSPATSGLLAYWLLGGGAVSLTLAFSIGSRFGVLTGILCFATAAFAGGLIWLWFRNRQSARIAESRRNEQANQEKRLADTDDPVLGGMTIGSIHDAMGDITLRRSLDGVILSANNTFRRISGWERPEGKTCDELGIRFRPGSGLHAYDVMFSTSRGNRTFLWHDVVTRDPVIDNLVIQSIARDVTNERADAFQHEQARLRAEEESDLKSRLIATVSHEIRTPLSGLLGMGHLLAGTKLTPEQANYLEGVRQSGTALANLVEDLLDFSSLTAGRFQIRTKRDAIRPLIESTVEMLSSRAHAKGIEIGAHIDSRLPEMLTFDAARFRQVLYNVIGNAVKFTETGGVLVSMTLEEQSLVVRITDSGPGMNEAETQRIFGEFEQGDLSRAREGGVGLGLAISARIMAETGGELAVESRIEEGSTFTIRLPLASGRDEPLRSGRELAGSRVLVFAPAGPAAAALAETLAGLGADTVSASRLEEVGAILDRHVPFNSIIVDHRLDGDFVASLRRDPRLKQAQRIFLVNPESRPAQMSGTSYHSWLIRPLREQSLIDVLTGKLKGLESRLARDEDFPTLSAEPSDGDTSAESHEKIKPPTATALSIVLGEDDPVNAMLCRAILEGAGHSVRLAENFATLEVILAEGADLLLTDDSMPDGKSDAFITRLRENQRHQGSHAPAVIVLTADATSETNERLMASGADLVLIKPVAPADLKSAIDSVVMRRLSKP